MVAGGGFFLSVGALIIFNVESHIFSTRSASQERLSKRILSPTPATDGTLKRSPVAEE